MVKNTILGKGTEAFFDILRRVLKECNRTLKDNGLLVFTFHHNKKDAWTTVKRALFDSGFYVVATHPVRSEMEVSTHIRNVRAIEYDVVVVCKKATRKKSIPWDTFSFSNESYSRTKGVVERLMPRRLKKVDVTTIAFGKNLELSWEGSNSNLSFPNIIKKLVRSLMQLLKT